MDPGKAARAGRGSPLLCMPCNSTNAPRCPQIAGFAFQTRLPTLPTALRLPPERAAHAPFAHHGTAVGTREEALPFQLAVEVKPRARRLPSSHGIPHCTALVVLRQPGQRRPLGSFAWHCRAGMSATQGGVRCCCAARLPTRAASALAAALQGGVTLEAGFRASFSAPTAHMEVGHGGIAFRPPCCMVNSFTLGGPGWQQVQGGRRQWRHRCRAWAWLAATAFWPALLRTHSRHALHRPAQHETGLWLPIPPSYTGPPPPSQHTHTAPWHAAGSGQAMLLVGYMVPASPGCTRLVRATFAARHSSPGLAGLLRRAVPRWLAHLSLQVGPPLILPSYPAPPLHDELLRCTSPPAWPPCSSWTRFSGSPPCPTAAGHPGWRRSAAARPGAAPGAGGCSGFRLNLHASASMSAGCIEAPPLSSMPSQRLWKS